MNIKPTSILCSALLCIAAAAPASGLAHPNPSALFGSAAQRNPSTRTVVLTAETRSVLVDSGETVSFRAGDRTESWTFLEAIGGDSVDLSLLFPNLEYAKGVRVFIQPSKLFTGG
ncbi:conserved exported protein of unknown function (plasmid) [Cupriavidus taiwanensis]|uniref:Heavy metal resistance protein CzcE n=1 Tax=Cupriavidus taiwanensis TaxID=164546 RepID=A0A9Q7V3C3_9BURK|nr:CzcE family metal-binding protein [Cupriavidus taiwanensis]SPD68842.1 conserved exported protein of unknown function [Cupriavidus taiwanensis]